MDKLRFVVIWMAAGFLVAVVAFVLGIEYFPHYITSTVFVLSLIILITIAVMAFFATNKKIPKAFNPKIEHLVDTINQAFYASTIDKKKEEGIKSLATLALDVVNKYFTSTFILGIIFSLTMVLVGVLAYAVVIKQNKIIQTQNFLICKQNEFLEGANRFGSYFDSKSRKLNRLFAVEDAIASELRLFDGCTEVVLEVDIHKDLCWDFAADATTINDLLRRLTRQQIRSYPSTELREYISKGSEISSIFSRNNAKQTDPENQLLIKKMYKLLKKADLITKSEIKKLEKHSFAEPEPINCNDFKPSS